MAVALRYIVPLLGLLLVIGGLAITGPIVLDAGTAGPDPIKPTPVQGQEPVGQDHVVPEADQDGPDHDLLDNEPGPTIGVSEQDTTKSDPPGTGITVAVLDTGIDATHPDLEGRVVERRDFVDDEMNPDELDPHGHGTHVAGVVAGTGTADPDRIGIAPGAELLDVRVMDAGGSGSTEDLLAGIEWAVEEGDADVLLLSLGAQADDDPAVAEALARAVDDGVVVVTSAGNIGHHREIGVPGQPAGVITVGAVDRDGAVAPFSSRGPTLGGVLKPDILAPGDAVVGPRSTDASRNWVDPDRYYTQLTGTSAAAPVVAGAATLVLADNPEATPDAVTRMLQQTARPIDDATAYHQGSGVISTEEVSTPKITVSEPAIDLGLVDRATVINRTITVTNHDDRAHELSFESTATNIDRDRPADGVLSVTPNATQVEPGETVNLTVTIDARGASGAYGGMITYSVDDAPRSIAVGFVRGGEVTVEKRPFSENGTVEGDDLWVFTEEGTHDQLLTFENGTASFVAGGGTYVLWSYGTDEPTGTTIFLSERHRFSGSTTVVLDERDTVPVGIDADPLVAEYGELVTLSKSVAMTTEYVRGTAELSKSKQRTENRTVRASADPDTDIATSYLLTTPSESDADMDVSDVFQLVHGVAGIDGPAERVVDPEDLETTVYRHHRSTIDEQLRVRDRVELEGVRNYRPLRWYDLGDRTEQRIHRLPVPAAYERGYEGDGWRAFRDSPTVIEGSTGVLAHPLIGTIDLDWQTVGTVSISGYPFTDGTGTAVAPPGDHRLEVQHGSEPIVDRSITGTGDSVEPIPLDPGDAMTVRLSGSNPGGHLSTTTILEVDHAGYRPGARVDNDPPMPIDVVFDGADATNAVPSGDTSLSIGVTRPGSVINPRVWYAPNGTDTPPWEDPEAWERADTWMDDDRIHASFDVPETADTMSIAARIGSLKGHETRLLTADAAHVDRAPNTSAAWLTGQVTTAAGIPTANDTLAIDPVDDGTLRHVALDSDGRFAVELPLNQTFELIYLQGEPWVGPTQPATDRPPWSGLARETMTDDVDLGTISLPNPHELRLSVTDERGKPVPNATVRVTHTANDVTVSETVTTDESGIATRIGDGRTGLHLAGAVNVTVTPPESDLYPEQNHTSTVTMDRDREHEVVLDTEPPTAALRALGPFEEGQPVFLDAGRSEVPAGLTEYRWDLNGDGTIDRVTTDRSIRYVPGPDTTSPRVTVVDTAGKTDTARVWLPLYDGAGEPADE